MSQRNLFRKYEVDDKIYFKYWEDLLEKQIWREEERERERYGRREREKYGRREREIKWEKVNEGGVYKNLRERERKRKRGDR